MSIYTYILSKYNKDKLRGSIQKLHINPMDLNHKSTFADIMSTTEIEDDVASKSESWPIEEDENEMDPQPPRLSHKQSFGM